MSDLRRVVVTGCGVISALGDSPAALHQALCEGRSAFRPVERFDADQLPVPWAAEVPFQARRYLCGNLRPLDRTGQMVCAAASLALASSGWEGEAAAELGLVLGTTFGSVGTIAAFDRRVMEAGPKYARPFDFANSVINAAAGQTAIWHGLRGLNSTIGGGAAAGILAIGYAVDMIRSGRARALLAGGAEELAFEGLLGFARSGHLATNNGSSAHPVPFAARRNGFWLGEGSALLMLEDADAAAARGATILAEIRGHASAFDPLRGRDPEVAAAAVTRAARQALDDAGLEPEDLDAVSTSANGSISGDRHEAHGLRRLFGKSEVPRPVSAVKAMLGEALGASGALQTVAFVESLRSGRLPGIPSLDELEAGIGLPGVSAEPRQLDLRRGLVEGLSHDGHCGALVVERWEDR